MKIAVVTGAGSGVGRALSLELCRRSWTVALIGHGQTSLDHTRQLAVDQSRMKTFVVDVSNANALRGVATQIVAELGAPLVWVNSAAVGAFGPVESMSDDELRRVNEVSYLGTVYGTRIALESMKPTSARTAVINVGSSLAFTTVPYNVAYGAAKAAVRSFTLGVALEQKDKSTKICIAHLPAMATPWFQKVKTTTSFQSRPVGPVHTAESVGKSLADLVEHPRSGDVYLGLSTVFVVTGARLAPRFTAWVAQKVGVRLQSTTKPAPTQTNLWQSVEPEPQTSKFCWTMKHAPQLWPYKSRSKAVGDQ